MVFVNPNQKCDSRLAMWPPLIHVATGTPMWRAVCYFKAISQLYYCNIWSKEPGKGSAMAEEEDEDEGEE